MAMKKQNLSDAPRELNPLDAARNFSPALRSMLSLADFDEAARKLLPTPLYAYVCGGVEDNRSRQGNLDSFLGYEFQPRVLTDVSRRTSTTTLLGKRYSVPFGIGPMGISALIAYDGDRVLAKAAAAEEIPMVLSGASLTSMEDVLQAGQGHPWFQAYLPGDKGMIEALASRAEKAGYENLVLTVDTAARANRENNIRAGFSTPLRPSFRLAYEGATHPRWLINTFFRTLLKSGIPSFENTEMGRGVPIISTQATRQFNRDNLNWEHVEFMRKAWRGNLILKGILHPEDARKAAARGVDAIVVSNHGGRQLDGAVAPLKVLESVAAASGAMAVIYDGGIRRGGDVLKALALGANFVFVGRPFIYAAAVAGEAGVRHCVSLLKEEVRRNMASLGITSIAQVNKSILLPSDHLR
ncbi:alpha-hydroxy acid oxidase [Xylophilus sp. GW821-FHT01B05]